MKLSHLFFAAAAVFTVQISAQELPPTLKLFPNHTILYLSFNDGNDDPDVGAFKKDPSKAEFTDDGLIGKALRSGRARIKMKDKMPTDAEGTIIMWVKMLSVPPQERFEPGCTFFSVELNSGGRWFLGCKGGGAARWGGENLMVRVDYPKTAAGGKHYIQSVKPSQGASVCQDWGNEWKMFAFTWTPDKIGISINGNPLLEKQIAEPLCVPQKIVLQFEAGCPSDKKDKIQYAIDECAVIGKKLSDAELASLYQEMIKFTTKKE